MAMEFGFFMRGQYPADQDMHKTFSESCEQARVADELGYTYLLKGQHYSTSPLQSLQLIPFLSRIMVEAPNAKLVSGIVLLPLHKPLDIAEQLASVDVMSGGRLIFGSSTARPWASARAVQPMPCPRPGCLDVRPEAPSQWGLSIP